MHFQYGAPATFIRVVQMPTTPSSPQRQRVFQADECLMLVVTSEIGTGATGIVHAGMPEVESPGQCISLYVVVKLAFSDHEKERLAHENPISGIPTLLGLFTAVDRPSALLMTYNCVSVSSNCHLAHGLFF